MKLHSAKPHSQFDEEQQRLRWPEARMKNHPLQSKTIIFHRSSLRSRCSWETCGQTGRLPNSRRRGIGVSPVFSPVFPASVPIFPLVLFRSHWHHLGCRILGGVDKGTSYASPRWVHSTPVSR